MNLDLEAARVAQEIITKTDGNKPSDVENLVTKTLGILHENGVYACVLYLYSRTGSADSKVSEAVREELLKMIKILGKGAPITSDAEAVLKFLTDNICNDLDLLLLTKQIWEQTLMYTRYSATARGVNK